MKHILLDILNNDTSYNKSATKMIKRTHPDLWGWILSVTSFLPDEVKPKQRVWHILNDCYIRPVCPITNEFLKWREKCYDKSASKEARYILAGKQLQQVTSGDNHWRSKDSVKSVTASQKYSDGLKSGRIIVDRTLRDSLAIVEKSKQTCLRKYGVDNPSKHPAIRKKISDIQIKNSATPKELRSLRDLYYEQVKYHTEQNWKYYFDNINPLRLNRSEVDLDHIYSKQQGFRESIPPYIIGHWTNLQMLDKRANYSKGMACGKTQEKLFEDFVNNRLNQ